MQIFIGAENPLFGLAGCSMVVAPYQNSREQVIGAIGVIGPARINYARIIPMVDYTAKVIGQILGRGIARNDRGKGRKTGAGAGGGERPGGDRRFGAPTARRGMPARRERLAAAEAEPAETKDRLLRALAETENVRRRLQRERDDAKKYAVERFAKICCRRSTIFAGP